MLIHNNVSQETTAYICSSFIFSTLNMEATTFSFPKVCIYQTACHHIAEVSNLQNHFCECLKCHIESCIYPHCLCSTQLYAYQERFLSTS